MNPPEVLLLALPPWLWLAAAVGGSLGAACKCLWPRRTPGLATCVFLFALGLAFGHLLALVGELPSWRLGDLRLLPGLIIAGLLVAVARPGQV